MKRMKQFLALFLCASMLTTPLDYVVKADQDNTETIEEAEPAEPEKETETEEESEKAELVETEKEIEPTEPIEMTEDLHPETEHKTGGYITVPGENEVAVLAETSLLKKNASLDVSTLNLSELHLAYFTNNTVTDPLGGTEGDSNVLSDSSLGFLDTGGNYMFSMQAYANWLGAADEEKAPYTQADTVLANGLDSKLAYDDSAHITGAYVVNINEDRENAKRLLMEYGALGINFCVEYSSYDEEHNSYYNPEVEDSDHAVTVVGWDDTFSKENFPVEAPGDGAWLVRNSWGDDGESFDGYFGMSYYEGSLQNAAYAFSFVEKGDEQLKAVSFETEETNEQYTVDIYVNLSSRKKPESGMHVQSIKGKTTYGGLYTVELEKPVYLQKGDKYAVVITLKKPGKTVSVSVENSIVLENWLDCTAYSKAGQSLVKENGKWIDYGEDGTGNFRIKAYTNRVKDLVPVKKVTVSTPEKKIGVGGTTRLNTTISPKNATNQKVTWTSSDETIAYGESVKLSVSYAPANTKDDKTVTWSSSNKKVAKVNQKGVVKAYGYGDATITAKVGKYAAKCKVTVLPVEVSYELKGGKNNKKNPKYITYDQYTSGEKIKLKNPTRKGYTFAGWYRDKKCTKKVTSIKGCKKNIKLYAKWKKA